jgi:hypothetical protein
MNYWVKDNGWVGLLVSLAAFMAWHGMGSGIGRIISITVVITGSTQIPEYGKHSYTKTQTSSQAKT